MALPKVGETISEQEFNALPAVGETISESQFNALPDFSAPEIPSKESTAGFGRRLKLSFGGKEAQEERKRIEEAQGVAGKFDVGDIADVAGKTLPFITSTIGGILGAGAGGVGAVPGAAIGASAGEAVRRGVGRAIGAPTDTIGKDVAEVAKEGIYTYAGGKILSKVGSYIASRLPKFLGLATGENPNLIKVALENPKVADLGIKEGDSALRTVLKKAADLSIKMRDAFIKGHAQAMKDQVFKDIGASSGWKRGAKNEVVEKFNSMLRGNRVKTVDGKLDFSTSSIKTNPGEVSKVTDAFNAIQNWKNWSQYGIHRLKQLVGDYIKFPTEAGGTAKSSFLKTFYGYLNEKAKVGLPNSRIKLYELLNKKFSDNIDLFDDMVKSFNSGDPFTRFANIMSENKDSLRQILEFYESSTGEKILPVIAGRAIAGERQAAFGLLNPREWIDFFYSPMAQAKTVTSLGRFAPKVKEMAKKIAPSVYTGVSEGVRKLSE